MLFSLTNCILYCDHNLPVCFNIGFPSGGNAASLHLKSTLLSFVFFCKITPVVLQWGKTAWKEPTQTACLMDLAFNGGSLDVILYFSFILAQQICKEGFQGLGLFSTKGKLNTFLCSQDDPQTLTGNSLFSSAFVFLVNINGSCWCSGCHSVLRILFPFQVLPKACFHVGLLSLHKDEALTLKQGKC